MSRTIPAVTLRLGLAALASALFLPTAGAQDVLLVTDWTEKKVMTLSPQDGSVINATFIPDGGRLRQPINAIQTPNSTILVSDQLADAIFEYDLQGQYIRTFTDLATSGLDAPKGIDIRDGVLYAVVSSGAMEDTIQKFDLATGAALGKWAGGFTNGADIHFRADDALLGDNDTDNVIRYNLDGTVAGVLVDSDGVNGIDLPYQIQDEPGGTLLVGGFAAPTGVYQYDAAGNQLNVWGEGFVRGGYRLGNGNLLYTQNRAITRWSTVTNTKIDDVAGFGTSGNFQFIERANLSPVIPEPGTLAMLAMGMLPLAGLRRRR